MRVREGLGPNNLLSPSLKWPDTFANVDVQESRKDRSLSAVHQKLQELRRTFSFFHEALKIS